MDVSDHVCCFLKGLDSLHTPLRLLPSYCLPQWAVLMQRLKARGYSSMHGLCITEIKKDNTNASVIKDNERLISTGDTTENI